MTVRVVVQRRVLIKQKKLWVNEIFMYFKKKFGNKYSERKIFWVENHSIIFLRITIIQFHSILFSLEQIAIPNYNDVLELYKIIQ